MLSECIDVVILDGAMSSKQLDLKYHLDVKKYNKKGRGNLPKCQFIRSLQYFKIQRNLKCGKGRQGGEESFRIQEYVDVGLYGALLI